MIDSKKIKGDVKKLLEDIFSEGYLVGKIEVSFDAVSHSFKIEIHQFSKEGETKVRKTITIF
jgi:hypothetical protein